LFFSVSLLAQNSEFDTLDFTYKTLPLDSYLSRPSLLLVDNDWSFDNKGLKLNCVEDESVELKYSRLLEDLGYSFDRFIVPSIGECPDSAFMQIFDAVIWVMGDNPELLPEERIHIANYLENGGRLLIIFPDPYIYDPNTSLPNPSILTFFETCLGISNGDNTSITPSTIRGVSGSIMASVNTSAKSDWAAGWSPMRDITDKAFVVSPLEDAEGLIDSWSSEYPYLAVAYSPTSETMENSKKFRSIFFGFELTFVSDYEARKDIMEKAINWLIRPRVAATSLGDVYTEIPCHVPIKITFNKSMDLSFLTQSGAITINPADPAVPITLSLSDKNKVLGIRPDLSWNSGNWSSGIEYTITISDSCALDADWQTLSSPFQLSFTGNAEADTTSPEVTSINPLNGAVDVYHEQEIEITFSAPIDPTTINTITFRVTQGEESITGHFCYLKNENKIIFSPHEGFIGGGNVLVTLNEESDQDNGLRAINGALVKNFSSGFTVKKPDVNISNYVIKKGYQLISQVQPGMRCTLELTLKNQGLSQVKGIMAVLKPVSDNIYPHYKNNLGITVYGNFKAYQEKCEDFSFTLSSTAPSLGEKVVFDVYSSDNFNNLWQDPNNLWQDSNSIWQDSNNVWRERISFAITETDKTPPNLYSSYTTVTPTRGIQQGTQISLSVYVDEPGELGEVRAELRSLDNELHASIPLTDPDGDNFYEGTWVVDIEGYYYVNVKATDVSGNMSELQKVIYLKCQEFQPSAPFLVVYDYDSLLGAKSLKQLFVWTQMLNQASIDFDLYVTGCEHDISSDILSLYSTVIWIIPQDSKGFCLNKAVEIIQDPNQDEIIQYPIQDEIIQYLDGGGNLLIAGKDVSSYYIRYTKFYLDYLHAVYVQDISLQTIVPADNTHPISGGIDLYRKEGMANEIDLAMDSNCIVEPIYFYKGDTMSSGTAALQVITDTYGVVYFAFNLEGLWLKENIIELIRRSLVRLSPPLITAVNPRSGSINVPLNSRIGVFFSEEMDTESVESAFIIDPYLAGTFTWDSQKRHLVYDYSNNNSGLLSSDTDYEVTIYEAASDLDGQNMQGPFNWTFTAVTGTETDTTPPTLSITPAVGSGNAPSDTIIEIQFSESMDMTTIAKEKLKVVGSFSGQIEGGMLYEYDVSEEKWKLTFDPYNELAGREQITVKAGEGWKDIAGNELTGEVSSFFTVRPSDQVYIVSYFPDTLEYGKFYSYFSVYIKNDSGDDLYDVKASIETSSEFMNQPHPIAYNPFIEMEKSYGWIGQGGIQNFYYSFYTPSECPENMDCSRDIQIPYLFRLSDEEDNICTDSFTLTISSPDLTPPEIVNIETDQHNGYIPVDENITVRCFIKEPGQVTIKASVFSDSLPAADEIQMSDPDNDRIFTGSYTPPPQCEGDYWLTLEATDAAQNTTRIEKALWFTSKPFDPDSQAKILVVFDYPKTGPTFDNYTSILNSYLEALDEGVYRPQYCLWETDVYGNISKDVMIQYDLIIWVIPYSFYSYHQGLVDISVQNSLMEYLDRGGNLLIAGDGTAQIDSTETLLYSDYFHTEYSDFFDYGYDGTLLLAEENDLISHNLNVYLESGNYDYSYYSCAQVITPKKKDDDEEDNEDDEEEESAEVKVIYTYEEYFEQGPGAAALRVSTQDYRLIYFAFDLDKIQSVDDRFEIMARSLNWLFPPSIVSVNPINPINELSARNSAISLYFNKQMDTNSVESVFHINPYVAGTFIWDSQKKHLVYDYSDNDNGLLSSDTDYKVTIHETASDQGGQNMKEDYIWYFTTGNFIDTTPPTLSITLPDPNTAVPPDSSIEMVFHDHMDRTTIDKENPRIIGSISGPIDGHITYDYDDQSGKWKLTLDPDKNFIGREQITVIAGEGWKDAAGNALTGEASSSFTIIRPEVYVVSSCPQDLKPGKFYSAFNLTLKNNSGFDLNNVKATLETSSEFVNLPYPFIYSSYINMENNFWKIEYDPNNPNSTEDLFFDFYLRSDCPEGIDCSEDILIPFILHLTDEEQNIWSDSFLLPLVESDTNSPELLLITKSEPDNYYVPLNEKITFYCLIKEPGWVNVKAYLISDPNFTYTFSDPNSSHNSAIDEIQLCDPNHNRTFTGAYTPYKEAEYWITIVATDLAENTAVVEKVLQFTSKPFVPDPGANILVVFDYPKTISPNENSNNYESILTRYMAGLQAGGHRYDVWEIDIYGNITPNILINYDIVIWINPYHSFYSPHYLNKGLTNFMVQENLMGYLDEGGNLLIAGQGTTDFAVISSTLYSDYLHAEYKKSFYYGFDGALLTGEENDPISHDLNLYLEAQNYFDIYGHIIRPLCPVSEEEAEIDVLYTYDEYPGQEEAVAGIRVSTPNYHLVYFAFDIDKIKTIDDLIALIGGSIDWLCLPLIASVNPVDGLNDVPKNCTISAYFNKNMNYASVEKAFGIDPCVAGTFIWDNQKRHLVYDYSNSNSGLLLPNTEYKVTINDTASNLNGETMKRAYEWSFTTGTSIDTTCPTLSIIPSDPNVDVSSDSIIEMVFSEQMDITTIDKQKPLVIGSASGLIEGQAIYDYDNQQEEWKLTLYPYNGFVGREHIIVSAGEGWKDLAGNELCNDISSSFPIERPDIYIVSFDPNIMLEPGKFYRNYPVRIKNESVFDLYEVKATLESFNECVNQPYTIVYEAYHNMKDTSWNVQKGHFIDLYFDFYLHANCPKIIEGACSQEETIPFILRLSDEKNTIWSDSFFVSLDDFDTTPPEIINITKEQDNYYIPVKWLDPNGGITIKCFIKEPGPLTEVKAFLASDFNSMADELQLTDPDNDRIFTGTYSPQDVAEYQVTLEATDLANNTAIVKDVLWFTSKPFEPDPEAGLLMVFDFPKTISNCSYDTIKKYQDSLTAIGYKYDVWEIDVYGNIPGEILAYYDVVIWIKPDSDNYYQHYQNKGLVNTSVQQNLMTYLDNGGNLLIAGKGTAISYSIYTSIFYSEYLHAEYSDCFNYGFDSVLLSAIEESPISSGLDLYLGSFGSDNYTGVIDPLYPDPNEKAAVNVLYTYDQYSGETTGIAALRVSTPQYHLVYFAFDLESLDNADNRTEIIEKSLEWVSPSFVFPLGTQQFIWNFSYTTDSYTIIQKFGEYITAIQRINSASGRRETAYPLWGNPAGYNFPIVPGNTYFLSITSPCVISLLKF